MERKMKMVSLFVAVLAAVSTTVPVASEDDESVWAEEPDVLDLVTQSPSPPFTATSTMMTTTDEPPSTTPASVISKKKLDLVKFGFYDKKRADRGLKPFLYGKKFELQNEFNANRYEPKGRGIKQESTVAPLITTPIRPLPYVSDINRLSRNQDNTLRGVRHPWSGSSAGPDEVTIRSSVESTKASYRDGRQKGDGSLMVVLPFNPSDESSVEELFTKQPFVEILDTKSATDGKSRGSIVTTTFPTRNKGMVTTTEFDRKSFLTRKPWRPTKRSKITTQVYTSTTENAEDATKTYTNYNDVEQVTKKFQIHAVQDQVANHKYEAVDAVTPYPVKRLRNKTPVPEEEGLRTAKVPTTPAPFNTINQIDLDEEKPNINFNLKRKSQRKTTTEDPSRAEGLKKVLEILPADMKDVILELDLNNEETGPGDDVPEQKQSDGKKVLNLKKIVQPVIDPKSYAVFKPIPMEVKEGDINAVSEDMKSFLASFGLLPVEGKRQQKAIKPEKRKKDEFSEASLNFLPEDMKRVLSDMGLMKYGNRKDETSIHVFNPSNHTVAPSDEDFEKLRTILSSIKSTVNGSDSLTPEMQVKIIEKIKELNELRYKNANLTEINDEIKKIILNKLPNGPQRSQTKRATKLSDGPNPLFYEEENLFKNDVKRQTTSSNSSSPISASDAGSSEDSPPDPTTTSPDATTTEESPNLEALKDSFGGGETASDSEDVDSALPPKRPNGLYLLFDWNSFFEVGTEDDSRRVNLRFQPKIGDSRNFLPVSVP